MNKVKRYDFELYHCNGGDMEKRDDGGFVSFEDYGELQKKFNDLQNEQIDAECRIEALKAERDALAAENAALKEVINSVVGVANNSQGISGWHKNGELAGWEEILPEIFDEISPSTEAFLLNVQADGLDAWINSRDGRWNGTTHAAIRFSKELRAQAEALKGGE